MLERHTAKIFSDAHILLQCRRLYARQTHYDILNLKKGCTNGEIRQSFAKLSKVHHPDTSKTGTKEQNSRKFQQIIEAYRVLSKKSSREAYDSEISDAPYPNYYATSHRRERRFYEGDFASWQQHTYNNNMNNTKYEYYRTRRPYDDPWSPTNVFQKKRVYGFIMSFVLFNFITVYFAYMMSRRSRIHNEFEMRRILAVNRHSTHSSRYQRVVPKDELVLINEEIKRISE